MKMLAFIFTTFFLLMGMTTAAEAGIGAAVSLLASSTIGGAIARIGVSLAVSFVANKLFAPDIPQDSAEGSPDPGVVQRISTSTNNKLPLVYGEAKLFGSITHAAITDDNQTMAFIIPLCEGPIQSIGIADGTNRRGVFWDTYELRIDNTGEVTGAWDQFGTGYGDTGHANYDDFLNGNLKVLFAPNAGRCNNSNLGQDAMEEFDTARWGDSNANNRTMPNTAYMYVELKYDRENQVTGLSSKFGAVVQGKIIERTTRSGTAPDFTFSREAQTGNNQVHNNPGDVAADYLTNTIYGAGNIVSESSLNLESFYNHNEYSDTNVTVQNSDGTSTTAKRFKINGVANTNDTRDLIISDICNNSSGVLTYQIGSFYLNTDKPITNSSGTILTNPQVVANTLLNLPRFDESNTFGDVTIRNDGFNSQLNKMTGSFNSKLNMYKDDQVYTEDLPSDLLNANEPEFIRDTRFKFINNNIQAERILYQLLRKSRDTAIVSFRTDISAINQTVNDIFIYNNTQRGIDNKLYRINAIEEVDIGEGLLGYRITGQEYNSTAYRDDTNDPFRDFAPAPNISLPTPRNVNTPTGFALTSTGKNTGDRTAEISVVPQGSSTEFLEFFYYDNTTSTALADVPSSNFRFLETRSRAEGGSFTGGTQITHTLINIPNSDDLYLFVRGGNSFGYRSQFARLDINEFQSGQVTDLRLINIYKRGTTAPTDFPEVDYTYNFTNSTGSFASGELNSWSLTVPSGTAQLYVRTGTVTNLNNVIASTATTTEWGAVVTSSEVMDGVNGRSVATLFIYTNSSTTPTAPANSNYLFNTDTLSNVPSGWSRNRADITVADGESLYLAQANISTTTPNTTTVVDWGTVVLASTLIFEVQAYLPRGENTAPGIPVTGSGAVTDGALSTAPTNNSSDPASLSWSISLPDVSDTNQYIYRSVAIVTNGIIGDWSTPALFALRAEQGPSGPTNLVRYGQFSSDLAAQTAHGTISTANGLNDNWVSTPDLLGIDGMNNPVPFTHTISQFGTITTGGTPATYQFQTGGTISSEAGQTYTRTITNSTSTFPFTEWSGQVNTSATNVYTADTAANYLNYAAPNNGWNRNTGLQNSSGISTAYTDGSDTITARTGFQLQGSINANSRTIASGSRRAYIQLRVVENGVQTLYNYTTGSAILDNADVNGSTFTALVTNFFSAISSNSGVLFSGRNSSSAGHGNASGDLRVFADPSSATNIFVGTTNTSTLRDWFADGEVTGIFFGLTFSASSNTPSQSVVSANSNANILYDTDWVRKGVTGDGATKNFIANLPIGMTRNGATLFTQNPLMVNWAAATTTNQYLNTVSAAIAAANNSFISSVGASGNVLTITFVADGATYAATGGTGITASANAGTISGTAPQQYEITITPTFKTGIDYSELTQARYSDSYTLDDRSINYSGITNNAGILSAIRSDLNGLSHMDVDVVTSGTTNSLRFRYTVVASAANDNDYTVLDGSTKYDGRVPNPFIHFGSDGSDIITGLTISTTQTGRGAGNLVNTRPTATFVSTVPSTNPYSVYRDYALTFDSDNFLGYPDWYRQLANAYNVIFNGVFTDNNIVSNDVTNTVTMTTISDTVSPSVEATLSGTGFVNTSVAGVAGSMFQIRLRRRDADEFNNKTVNIQLSAGDTPGSNDFIDNTILPLAPQLGAYMTRVSTGNFQIQDAGTGPTTFDIAITSGSGGTAAEVTAQRTAGVSPTLGNDFNANRWTRPVNNGVQVS